MSVTIHVEQVTKKYGDHTVIDGLSVDIRPGEFFTLLGPSGCGKTTLLRMIIGFNSIESGTISVNGKVINQIPTNRRNMGMVFQNYAIFPHMSVFDNVAFGLKMRGLSREEIANWVEDILKTVKIDSLRDRMPNELSGGQQQRVALARAIVPRPEVLLMDEPLSNLDAKLRVEMRNAIKSIQRKTGITTMYVTHDQEEALAVSDRIAVMNGGIIQQIDTPQRIYQRPQNLFVSTFIGLSNVLDGVLTTQDGILTLDLGEGYRVPMSNLNQKARGGQKVCVSVRPEEFVMNPSGGHGITAVVSSSVFLGASIHYFLQSKGREIEVIQSGDDLELLQENTPVCLTVKPEKINVFSEDGSSALIQKEE
jgi:iron(III) transport system ATP-binding protein